MSLLTLRAGARWTFLAALIVAPWMYGGTTATSIVVIDWLLGAALLLWVLELIVNRRLPTFPKLLLVLLTTLVVIGVWMTINARSIYDAEFGTFAAINNFAPHAPGSVDYAISVAWMIRAALLIGAVLFVVDLSQDDKCLIQLWVVLAIAAGSISLLGLLQKATGAPAIFWQTPIGSYGSNFFATYYYHANAGAFLNLVLPLTAGLAVRVFGLPASPGVRSIWLTVFLLNLAAVAANTSRMAQLIAVLILLALLAQLGPRVFRGLSRSERNTVFAGGAAILLAIYAIGQATHLDRPVRRWEQLGGQVLQDARWSASRIALNTLPSAGFFGFGPGTFRAIFPAYSKAADPPVAGQWRFLHEDYLQTAMEWGWLGSLLWAVMFFGGLANAVLCLRRQTALRRVSEFTQEWSWRRRLILPLAVIALAGVAVHALVDFPLQIVSIQLYVATYLGLCWGSARWGPVNS